VWWNWRCIPDNEAMNRHNKPRARLWRWGRIGTVVVLALVAANAPPVSARLKALGVTGELLDVPVPRPFAADVERIETSLGGVEGDLYRAGSDAPGLVLLPGATPAGRDDTRAVEAATAVARADRTVFVPELSLYQRRIDGTDLERIVNATRALADETGGRATLLGFSYGGSYGLVAAADERLRGHLAQVATFGSYADLGGVIQAATTGASTVDGQVIPWDGDPRAGEILRDATDQLVDEDSRGAVEALLANDDPHRTPELIEALPRDVRATLDRFSPTAVAHDIEVPVVAIHAVDDPAVPYVEGERLVAAIPQARLLTVELFRHVDYEAGDLVRALPDLWRTWRFAGWVLASQERW
jgi:pimeloyl-ACP methyl ester carboxylesterase